MAGLERFEALMRRMVFGLAVCVPAALCLVLLQGGCGSKGDPGEPVEAGDLPDQEVTEFSLTETVGGSKSWTLFADRAEVFEEKRHSRVHGVKIQFYGPDGEVTSVLTSKRGQVDDESKDLQAFGEVVVETSEGVTLQTEALRWDNRRERIWSSEFVTVTREREVLTGYGFDSDPDLKNVQVHKQVKISVRGDSSATGEGGG